MIYGMFANSTFAVLYELHRFTMVIEVLALILIVYIVGILVYKLSIRIYDTVPWQARHLQLELAWTAIPACIVLCLINLGIISGYAVLDVLPASSSYDIIGYQWYWQIARTDVNIVHNSGLNIGDLHLLEVSSWLTLPVHTAIRIYLSAYDVIHSFAIPSLGIKMDCIPGRLNHVTLSSSLPGIYYGQCSELCGALHGFMPIKLVFS
jgi:heme/copper-type cytochrome/quinol oxidase subunit 2